MPIGIQRLNQGGGAHHPNDRIIFIKTLPGPSSEIAQNFLSRIAAICVPIMRKHHLSVMTLEEHEPNPEFIGRNFNAGEIIQLVLKAPRTGRWLPFRFVQMVMMHELAHCVQMNHSRAFWAVRNEYAGQLRDLWSRNYTGEGLWGRGLGLYSGQYEEERMPGDEDGVPQSLCGGTFRSRGRRGKKRKRAGDDSAGPSYAERKQRRIEKRFGGQGSALGEDDDTKALLEKGKTPSGKPKVAKSKRGRDLRAAAAIQRLEQEKKARQAEEEPSRSAGSDTESESDYGDADGFDDLARSDDSGLFDSKGRHLFKVCEDEDAKGDERARRELDELQNIGCNIETKEAHTNGVNTHSTGKKDSTNNIETSSPKDLKRKDSYQVGEQDAQPPIKRSFSDSEAALLPKIEEEERNLHDFPTGAETCRSNANSKGVLDEVKPSRPEAGIKDDPSSATEPVKEEPDSPSGTGSQGNSLPRPPEDDNFDQHCPVCSLSNSIDALTCAACAHVLSTDRLPRYWRCTSEACRNSKMGQKYINAEDAGVCGVCGASRVGKGE